FLTVPAPTEIYTLSLHDALPILQFESVDVGRLVPEAVDHIRNLAAMKGIAIDVHMEGSAGVIEADPMRLAQVITNLLGNAIKFSDRKSTRLNSSHSQISYAVFCL